MSVEKLNDGQKNVYLLLTINDSWTLEFWTFLFLNLLTFVMSKVEFRIKSTKRRSLYRILHLTEERNQDFNIKQKLSSSWIWHLKNNLIILKKGRPSPAQWQTILFLNQFLIFFGWIWFFSILDENLKKSVFVYYF